jgi:hypothetical protein
MARTVTAVIAFSVAALVAALSVYLWRIEDGVRGPSPSGDVAVHASQIPTPLAAPSEDLMTEPPNGAALTPVIGLMERSPAAAPLQLRTRVTNPSGAPIANVVASWTPLNPDFGRRPWRANDWATISAATVNGSTDGDGHVVLARANAPNVADSVVWLSKPGYESREFVLADAARGGGLPPHVVLEPAPPVSVVVEFPDGTPVPGALVEHHGWSGAGEDTSPPDLSTIASRLYYRSAVTDADGGASLGHLTPQGAVQASFESKRSRAAFATSDETIVLHLTDAFSIAGRVRLGDDSIIASRLALAVGVRTGDELVNFATLGVETDGRIRDTWLPVVSGDRLEIRLSGSGIVPLYETFPLPPSGTSVVLDLEPIAGASFAVLVMDPSETPIPGADVFASWPASHGVDQAFSDAALSGVDGRAELRGMPSDIEFVLHASAPGYATRQTQPRRLPAPDLPELAVMLTPLGRLAGRVEYQGRPVPEFDLLCWRSETQQLQVDHFVDADGHFELTSVPARPVTILAAPPGLPRSASLLVDPREPNATNLLLVVESGVFGRGRVQDLGTRQPVVAAVVQPYTNDDFQLLTPQGNAVVTDAQGRFEVANLPPSGKAALFVTAEGCSPVYAFGALEGRDNIDFGIIGVSRDASIEVRLAGDVPTPCRGYSLYCTGARTIDGIEFGDSGRLVIDACQPGTYNWRVRTPSGSETTVTTEHRVGARWLVEIPVNSGRTVSIELESASSCPASGIVWLAIATLGADDRVVTTHMSFARAPTLDVPGVPVGRVSIGIALTVDAPYEWHEFVLPADQQPTLSVRLSCVARPIQFIDADGAALPNAIAYLTCTAPGVGYPTITDGNGIANFGSVDCEQAYLSIQASSLFHFGLPIRLDPPGSPLQVVQLEPSCSMRLCISDGEQAMAGIQLRPIEANSRFGIMPLVTDENGVCHWEGLRAAAYELPIAGTGLWPIQSRVIADRSSTGAQIVQVRRTGALVLSVRTLEGPASELAVELTSREFGEDVSDWIEAGRLPAPSGGLVTDSEGRLTVSGIPCGTYDCRVTLPDGSTVAAEVEVVAETSITAEIALP